MHGLPAALTSFIGREEAVREVAGLLEEYRLVTVTGPGGAGKTRLAGEVARAVAGRFADGVWLAELAPVTDPALVPAVVAAALGVREQPGVRAEEALPRVMARQQLMLVLDNCEHVIGAAAELCAGLLAACDDVRVLTTSREPLAVAGEGRYRLGPLSLPDLDDAADAGGSEAVALFADRARQADAHFLLDGQSGPAIARLVTRLDGMPLAIELAAARVEALGAAQLVDRLDDRFALLAGGDRLAAERHRSLAATVEWSYQLLDERERSVLRQVSVFPAPFTLEAAEAVAGPGADRAVLHLVDCSLLSPPRAGPDGRSRYAMLETLRAYAAGLLAETGEADGVATALARFALRVAEAAAVGLDTGTGELAAARWLDAEDATMQQVLAWAMDHDAAMAFRLGVALAPWWLLRGRTAGGYPLLREAAGRAAPRGDTWCAAQFWLGQMAWSSADLAKVLGHYTAVCEAIGDRGPSRALAACLAGRSLVLSNQCRAAEAAADARRSLAVARELRYPVGEAEALMILGIAAANADNLGDGVRLARQALQIPADVPSWRAQSWTAMATQLLMDAGDLAEAERSCLAGLARAEAVGDVDNGPWLLIMMAHLDVQAGRADIAAARLHEAFQIASRTSDQTTLHNALECAGSWCAATGRFSEAITVWAAMETLSQPGGYIEAPADLRRRDEPLRSARQALGPDHAQEAAERGAAMSLDTAAEYALMLTAPGPPQPQPASLGRLSARERELVTLVARGRTDAQIAAQLYISIRTVRSHLDRIRDKTGCRRRADLTRLALAAGLL